MSALLEWLPNLLLVGLVWFLYKQFANSQTYRRLVRSLSNDVMTNWRLVLLGITGIVLSVASGWTTWDGMTNFTRSPLLSLLITFGIQGIMLIAAWLIGETFAQSFTGKGAKAAGSIVGALFGVFAVIVIGLLAALLFFPKESVRAWTYLSQSLQAAIEATVILTLGLILLAGAIYALGRGEVIAPYVRGTKVIMRNLPLWIMFLACMATSVFFSFDSLFSTIFPQDERARAAELRVRNHVQGVIADVGVRIRERRKEAIEDLFESKGWVSFNSDLTRLVEQSTGASEAVKQLKLQRVQVRTEAEQHERLAISSATVERESLLAEKARLDAEIESVRGNRPPEQIQIEQLEKQLQEKRSQIIAAETAMKGEERGVRGTGKAGRGPEWRKLKNNVADLKLDEDELNSRLAVATRRLKRIGDQTSANRKRLGEIAKRLAALGVEARAAEERLKVQGQASQNDLTADLDAAGGLKALERERAQLRREPTRVSFDKLQTLCGSLLATVRTVPQLRAGTEDINCQPKAASDAAARVFSFNDALAAYREQCAVGERVAGGTADSLLQHGSTCIQESRLSGNDTEEFRGALNRAALNRDDKAHRFVVTVNAFSDGNRLAYLALAIAIAIDGLVFMSGLFGANAVRSPLADAPIDKSRTAVQLETTVNNSLGPEGAYRYSTARLVLESMRPITPEDGYMAQVDLSVYGETEAARIRNVLNAGATLNLVDSHTANPNLFRVRSEFFEYLNLVCERQLQTDSELREELRLDGQKSEKRREEEHQLEEAARQIELLLEAATEPHHRAGAESALRSMRPLTDHEDYTNYIDVPDAIERYNQVVRQIFNSVTREVIPPRSRNDDQIVDLPPDTTLQLQQIMIAYEDTLRHILNVGATRRAALHGKGKGNGTAGAVRRAVSHDKSKGDEFFLISPEFHRALVMLRKKAIDHGQESLDVVVRNRALDIVQPTLLGETSVTSLPKHVTEIPPELDFNETPAIADARDLRSWLTDGEQIAGDQITILRDRIIEDFCRRLGIDMTWYQNVEVSRGTAKLAETRNMLQRVANQSNALASRISGIVQNKKMELEEARKHFVSFYGPNNPGLVHDVADELGELIGALAIPKIRDEIGKEVRSVYELRERIGSPIITDDGTEQLQVQEEYGLREAFQTIAEFEQSPQINEQLPDLIMALADANKILKSSLAAPEASGRA
ncbi:MAG: hypothetical protein V3V97_06260 [Hyphomicrobiaceae bacterium]